MFTTLIDVSGLEALLRDGRVTLFDCRFDLADSTAGCALYAAGHIADAHYLNLDDDLSARPTGSNGRHPLPDRDALARTLRACGLNKGQQVVAYDASGGIYAARLWWLLRWLGHDAVAVLDGGLQAWEAAGLPLASLCPDPTHGDFQASQAAAMPTATAADILREGERLSVVDARAPHRFRGEPDPLDPVAGHIPGARNRFFRDNLREDGHFKAASTLASEWRALAGSDEPHTIVHQCGSGVTAAHNLLAMELAGLRGARLYPGSWSEWISDPSRPVERG
ncbi:sulfurtransferase [uncultured Sphingomonas sp.]|uniref:sulfurtransferase n=1 Tax=uncultured Sphingomonas sp. TaxID=158754 RepID=UPI0025EC28AF|nr:sulfurtransferase [uncultured Sphingomonas sp.]